LKLNERKISSLFYNKIAETNEFNNGNFHWLEFPDLWKHMNKTLPAELETVKVGPSRYGIDISPHCIDIQRHDRSIAPHDDSITEPQYFQMVVVKLTPQKGNIYEVRPVFHYYDENGKKKEKKLNVGDSVVFNPRKTHSMIYYGHVYTVGIRAVSKKRK
jgi:hypothetical protein